MTRLRPGFLCASEAARLFKLRTFARSRRSILYCGSPPYLSFPMSRESLAKRSLIVAAALILLLEEWIWNVMQRATARLAAHPWVQAAERKLAQLEPIEALCAFALPMLALLPFKLAAV